MAIILYKKILFYLMLADSTIRLSAAVMLAVAGEIHLPVVTVVIALAVALFGGYMTVKSIKGRLSLNNLAVYHLTSVLATIVSFLILHFYIVDVSLIETLITGSVLSVMTSITLLFMTFRKKRYVTIRKKQLAAKE